MGFNCNFQRVGDSNQKTFRGRVMDIFWNNTFLNNICTMYNVTSRFVAIIKMMETFLHLQYVGMQLCYNAFKFIQSLKCILTIVCFLLSSTVNSSFQRLQFSSICLELLL